jgi:hypothetical protein
MEPRGHEVDYSPQYYDGGSHLPTMRNGTYIGMVPAKAKSDQADNMHNECILPRLFSLPLAETH